MECVLLGLFTTGFAGLIWVYALLINEMSKGLERQRRHNEALRERLRKKGISE